MSQDCRKLYFAVVLFISIFVLYSCDVEECPCSSVLNGRWIGEAKDSAFIVFMMLNLNSKSSNLEGTGTLVLQIDGFNFEDLVTCDGSFVGNKVVFKINEIDSLSFEGVLNSHRDTIDGKLFFRTAKLSLLLVKVQSK